MFCLRVRGRQEIKERVRSRVILSKEKQNKNERGREGRKEEVTFRHCLQLAVGRGKLVKADWLPLR